MSLILKPIMLYIYNYKIIQRNSDNFIFHYFETIEQPPFNDKVEFFVLEYMAYLSKFVV
jgi:hypothetical protein